MVAIAKLPAQRLTASLVAKANAPLARSARLPTASQPFLRRFATAIDDASKQAGGQTASEQDAGKSRARFEVPGSNNGPRGPQVRTLVIGLCSIGALASIYVVWDWLNSFETWPPQLREDLRAAIKMRNMGEISKAERRFQTALETAKGLDPELLAPSPLLKITGISIALASMLEDAGQLDQAYTAYKDALELCYTGQDSVADRTGPERARAAAIAQKMGEVALRIADVGPSSGPEWVGSSASESAIRSMSKASASGDDEVALPRPPPPPLPTKAAAYQAGEDHLVWSVHELLRLSVPDNVQQQAAAAASAASSQSNENSEQAGTDPVSVSLADLELPPWVRRTDLLGSVEALGSFYAREGRVDYAIPLYLQALEILIPTSPQARKPQSSITVADRCRASIVMNNVSQLFLEGKRPEDPEFQRAAEAAGGKEQQALSWAKKGLALVQSTNAKAGWGLGGGESTQGQAAPAPSQAKELVGARDEARTAEVRRECVLAEVTLLVNLGHLSQLASDKCAARNYLQRAYRLADREGFREAKNRAASALAGLERFKKA